MRFLLILFLFPGWSFAKYQVCSITINSSDEIESFREFLPESQFEFIELLPSSLNSKKDQSSHWFDRACKKDYNCDILVISGHFGGTFFGESGYTLPIELMEEKSCQQSCPGILSGVKEIFLFGCNTLANKEKDHRTYTEYLQVLLDDGMFRETAERVVAARYSPLETPFYARMNFIFSGSHTIYGFDELSPLGKHIRQPLRRYFENINARFTDYANYLDSGAYKRKINKELFKELPRSAFSLNQAQISFSGESEGDKEFFKNKCLLYNDKSRFSDQMQAMEAIFSSKKAGSGFFAIDHFLTRNKERIESGQGRFIFRSIKNNAEFSREFLSYYTHLGFLPHIKIIYLNLLEKLQWIDPVPLHVLRKESLLEVIKLPTRESYISVLFLLQKKQIKPRQIYLSKEDLPEDYADSFWGLLIFEKLRFIAPQWQESIFSHCREPLDIGFCHQSLNTLAHIGLEPEMAQELRPLLNHSDTGIKYYALRALGQSGAEDYKIHAKIADFLDSEDPNLRQEAVEALGFLRSPYDKPQESLSRLLMRAGEDLAHDILWALNQMPVESQEAQAQLLKYLSRQEIDPLLFEQTLKIFQNSPYLSDFSLYFFYNLLEEGEKNPLFFPVLELISKNSNFKDIGLHYRLLLFQSSESVEFKRKALQSLEGLSWLHPEAQIPFLDYFRDSDPKVRQLAFQVLRGVKNLQSETRKEIKKRFKEEGIKEMSALAEESFFENL